MSAVRDLSLYALTGNLAQLRARLDTAVVDPETGECVDSVDLMAEIEALGLTLADAVDVTATSAIERDAVADALDAEAGRLQARSAVLRAHAERERAAILTAMEAAHVKRLECRHRVVTRVEGREKVEVTDLAVVPSDLRHAPKPPPRPEAWEADKVAALPRLKDGEAIPGLRLVRGNARLNVK